MGATVTVPDSLLPGGDGLWQFGEFLPDQLVQVGVIDPNWRMTLAIYGVNNDPVNTAGQAAELLGVIELDASNMVAPMTNLFLPLVAR